MLNVWTLQLNFIITCLKSHIWFMLNLVQLTRSLFISVLSHVMFSYTISCLSTSYVLCNFNSIIGMTIFGCYQACCSEHMPCLSVFPSSVVCTGHMSWFNCYIVCLVYFSYSRCEVLYLQVCTFQFNFIIPVNTPTVYFCFFTM